jgi:hypothetical protein
MENLKEMLYRQIIALNTDNKEELELEIKRAEAVCNTVGCIVEIEKIEFQKVKLLLSNGYVMGDQAIEAMGMKATKGKTAKDALAEGNTSQYQETK